MKFNPEHKVIIETLSKDEARAFIKFLRSEIIRHQDDIMLARKLIVTTIEEKLEDETNLH